MPQDPVSAGVVVKCWVFEPQERLLISHLRKFTDLVQRIFKFEIKTAKDLRKHFNFHVI